MIKILAFQLLLIVITMIERAIAIPFVTVLFFLASSRAFSTEAFFVYASLLSLFLAAIFMQDWILLFIVLVVGGIIVRANIFRVQTSFLRLLILIATMGFLISLLSGPVISSAYVFHSLLSFFIATVLGYRWFSLKEKKLRWKNIRFGESD